MLRGLGARLRPCALCNSSQLLARASSSGAMEGRAGIINQARPFPEDSDFRRTIEHKFCYVDRTQFIKPLLKDHTRVLFLRPRRFGKSLWLSTLEEFFSGDSELFKGLAVSNEVIKRGGFTWSPGGPVKHRFPACPVIRFDFSQVTAPTTVAGVEKALQDMVQRAGAEHHIEPNGSDAAAMAASLIGGLARSKDNEWEKVVVLVDEYDALWAAFLDPELAKQRPAVHRLVKAFFSTLKSMTRQIEFTFVTGIAPVALTGLLNGPNDLNNLSMDSNLRTLMGFTQAEVVSLLEAKNLKFDLQEVKRKYKGQLHSFWDEPLLKPLTLLHGLRPALQLPATISETELLSAHGEFLGDRVATKAGVLSFLFHTGCATIKRVQNMGNEAKFDLDYLNEETKRFMLSDMFGDGSMPQK